MSNKTAVEQLEEKLKVNLKSIIINNDDKLIENLFLEAKEIEKQQIIDSWVNGGSTLSAKNAEKYYNEMYEK